MIPSVATGTALAGTILAGARHAIADPVSPGAPKWGHIRVLGRDLGTPRMVIVGASPSRSVGVVDFDADGVTGIAVGGATAANVAVFRGDGLGHFER
jgi:hypothetical protein